MNILIIYNNAINPNAGGIARISSTLADLFRQNGHSVWFLAFKRSVISSNHEFQLFLPSNKIDSDENIDFLNYEIIHKQFDVILNQCSIDKGVLSLLQKIKEQQCQAKIVTCFHTSILTQAINAPYQEEYKLKKKNKKWLYNLMCSRYMRNLIIKLYILKWRSFYKKALSVCDYSILLNHGQVLELQQMTGCDYNSKIKIIANCVPDSCLYDSDKENSVIWCGDFNIRIKRPDLMLLVWSCLCKNFPEWKLYMVGDGKDLDEMKEYAKSLDVTNVVFTGRISPKDIMNLSKIACVTSTHETFSLVAVESMTSRMPVIAFNSFTMAEEIIKNGYNGYLIEKFSIKDYVEKLSNLMSDDQKRRDMGLAARNVSDSYRPDKIYECWKNFFEQII